jgi:hypothetical protein
MDKRPSKQDSVFAELKRAGLGTFVLITVVIAAAYAGGLAYLLLRPPGESISVGTLGQFGDSFGALTALLNALALAALVATVVLQSKELRESREQLVLQAQAQAETAKAAREQIEQARQLEHLKIRPVLRAEWKVVSAGNPTVYELRMRNVGLGVAIIGQIEITFNGKSLGIHDCYEMPDTRARWELCIWNCLNREKLVKVTARPYLLDNNNCAIAPGESQPIVEVDVGTVEGLNFSGERLLDLIQYCGVPIIQFCSIAAERYSTADQHDYLIVRDSTQVGPAGIDVAPH